MNKITTLTVAIVISNPALSYEMGDSLFDLRDSGGETLAPDNKDVGLMKKASIQNTGESAAVSLNVAKYYLGGGQGKRNGIPMYIIATPNVESRLSKEKIKASLANNDLGVLNIKLSDRIRDWDLTEDSTRITWSSALGVRAIESIDPDSGTQGTERIGAAYFNAGVDISTKIYGADGLTNAGALTFTFKLAANHFSSIENIEEVLSEDIEQSSASLAFGASFEIDRVVDFSIMGNVYNTDENVGNGLNISMATKF